MTIEDIQQKIITASDKIFGLNRSFRAPLHHLKMEVDETIDSGDIEEFADMFLLIMDSFRLRFPNKSPQDLLLACDEKIQILYKRKWGKPNENGVIEHIRD